MRRLLSSLRHDERGVSAVEFAFLIPILATLILGIIDLSTALSQRFTLQQAVNRSLECGLLDRDVDIAKGLREHLERLHQYGVLVDYVA